jgi:hypothetical protein
MRFMRSMLGVMSALRQTLDASKRIGVTPAGEMNFHYRSILSNLRGFESEQLNCSAPSFGVPHGGESVQLRLILFIYWSSPVLFNKILIGESVMVTVARSEQSHGRAVSILATSSEGECTVNPNPLSIQSRFNFGGSGKAIASTHSFLLLNAMTRFGDNNNFSSSA